MSHNQQQNSSNYDVQSCLQTDKMIAQSELTAEDLLK